MPTISGQELYLWRKQAINLAKAHQVSDKEVDWLLQEVAGLDSLSLRLESFQHRQQIVLTKSLPELTRLWQQRLQERLPIQYLLETAFWRRFKLTVAPGVLIPRPETELIIDLAVAAAKKNIKSIDCWVDLGTGSGAIALGLAANFPDATIYAVDCSSVALAIAKQNAYNLDLETRIKFYQGNWWSPLDFLLGKVGAMISNPPYIPTSQLSQLQPEVVKHEPHLALDGGSDGLDHIRHLAQVAPDYLVSGGIWLVEMMAGQAEMVEKILQEQGKYRDIQIFSDFAGIQRFALAYRF
ncbi:MAG: peptide chain release factor N(5)-glutamine methyltransferase [Pleurocapsa sp.]